MRYSRSLLATAALLAVALPAASALGGRPAPPAGGKNTALSRGEAKSPKHGAGPAVTGNIALIAPWGNAAYNASVPLITVTYTISASPAIPPSARHGVQAAIDHWNNCLYSGSNSFSDTLGSDSFSTTDSGCSTLSFKGDWHFVAAGPGTTPLVKISIKKGGGQIAGQTHFGFNSSGFLKSARVQISGSSFGLANDAQMVWNIAEHELGHVVGLGHSNVSTDLMNPVINGHVQFGSCEINGAEALYSSWLPSKSSPALPASSSVAC